MNKLKDFFRSSEDLQQAKDLIVALKSKELLKSKEKTALAQAKKKVRAHVLRIFLACTGVAAAGGAITKGIANHNRHNTLPRFSTLEELLSPVEYEPHMSREQVPTELPKLLAPYAEVTTPKNYDPQKPNLYIIGQMHFEPGKVPVGNSEQELKTFWIQTEILKISHLLIAADAKRQFIEGIADGFELTHLQNKRAKGSSVDEVPSTAMTNYKTTGKIRRASMALEGIYQGSLESKGMDVSEQENTRRMYENRFADNVTFVEAKRQILSSLCDHFRIPLSPLSTQETEPEFMKRLAQEIFTKVKTLSPQEQTLLFANYALENASYQQFLRIFVENQHFKFEGRSSQFADSMKKQGSEKEADSICVVGFAHFDFLIKTSTLENFNVIGIKPLSVIKAAKFDPAKAERSADEWRKDLMEIDKKHFGFADPNTK